MIIETGIRSQTGNISGPYRHVFMATVPAQVVAAVEEYACNEGEGCWYVLTPETVGERGLLGRMEREGTVVEREPAETWLLVSA